MKSFRFSTLPGIGLTLIAMTLATNIHAEVKIFKSVDANGNVTYGDQPTDGAVDFELIEMAPIPRTSDGADLDKRLDRMAAATKRLKSDREARESERITQQPPANTVVYYPAYQGGNSGGHYHRDDHRAVKRHRFDDRYGLHSPYNAHRKNDSLHLGVGFRSSHLDGSLQLGSRRSSNGRTAHHTGYQKEKYGISPFRSDRRTRAYSPQPNTRPKPRNQR